MLTHGRDGIAFRHELARLAVEPLLDAMKKPVDENFDGDVEFAARAILERFELQDDEESQARISRLIRRITGVDE